MKKRTIDFNMDRSPRIFSLSAHQGIVYTCWTLCSYKKHRPTAQRVGKFTGHEAVASSLKQPVGTTGGFWPPERPTALLLKTASSSVP